VPDSAGQGFECPGPAIPDHIEPGWEHGFLCPDGNQDAAVEAGTAGAETLQAHGRDSNLTPAFFLRKHGVQIRGVRSVEDGLPAGMPAQLQWPVPLENKNGARVGPAGDDGGDLTPAAHEARLEPLDIHGTVPGGVRGQAEQNLAVHLGEASQLPTPEQVIGVVDGAVVGADHLPGADWVVVAVDPLVPTGAPTGVSEEERGAVVYGGRK